MAENSDSATRDSTQFPEGAMGTYRPPEEFRAECESRSGCLATLHKPGCPQRHEPSEYAADHGSVSIMFRDEGGNDAHRQVGVFVGRQPGARGKAGVLTVRADEWEEFHVALSLGHYEIGDPL